MNLLVTGASGYLGRRLTRRAAERGWRVLAAYGSHPGRLAVGEPVALDLRRPEAAAALLARLSPEAIVHAAALNPGGPEEEMAAVNTGGSRAVAAAAAASGARLVHVSTDVVHDGTSAPYPDAAPPTPRGAYGRSKAEAEPAVLEACPGAAVVRTSLIYALDEMDHGTAGFAARLAAGEAVELFADVVRQPVWAETLAEALLRLAEGSFAGPLNVAGSQALSRDAFGRRMLAFWQVPGAERVAAVSAAEKGLEVPLDLRLELDRARRVLEMELPGVDEVLERFAFSVEQR